jgi:hypothetical protein
MRPADKAENHGEQEAVQTVAKHQIATRQGSSQQGCKRTQFLHEEKQQAIQTYLASLSATEATEK